MPRDLEIVIKQSLLDRLTDTSRDSKTNAAELSRRSESFRLFREGVKRDIEWLLNTRQIADPAEKGCLSSSLYNYGLPDITSMGLHSSRDRERLTDSLERTLQNFEPRIAGLKVHLEPVQPNTRVLRFRIDGFLRVEPAPEPVTFKTILEVNSGQYEVK